MTWTRWGLFVTTELVLCLMPGPAVLFVVAQALRYGGRRSLWANAGILTGNALYFVLSATGLSALLAASHSLFLGIKWAGAGYLIYLGLQLWRRTGTTIFHQPLQVAEPPVHGPILLGRGFIVQAANPKALLFFTALLPQFIDVHQSVTFQVLILGATALPVEFVVLACYGVLAGQAAQLASEPRFSRLADRVAGTLLIGTGASLAVASDG